jgi:hypothetical protein
MGFLGKILAFTFLNSSQADSPVASFGSSAAFKTALDSQATQLQTSINGLIDALNSSTPGSSGSENLASAAITGVSGATTYAQSVALKALIDGLAAGTGLTDGAITSAKILDGTIVNADVNASAAIDGSKLANLSITSAQIADGTIMNVDINASAAIDATKIGAGTVSNTEFGYLDGVNGPIQTQLANATLGAIADGSITDVKLDNGGTSVKAKANAALPSTSYTAADVLTKIKTVDGAGSGLDADLLDGLDSSAFPKIRSTSAMASAINPIDGANIGVFDNRAVNGAPSSYATGTTNEFKTKSVIGLPTGTVTFAAVTTHMPYNDISGYGLAAYQIAHSEDRVWTRRAVDANTWGAWKELLHDDGSGNVTIAGALTAGAGGSFANSKATNGYQKLPGGLIIQWGGLSVVSGNNPAFPIAFPTAVASVTVTSGTASPLATSAFSPQLTYFTLYHANGSTPTQMFWIAIGW